MSHGYFPCFWTELRFKVRYLVCYKTTLREENNYEEWLSLVLDYYDRTYGRNVLEDKNKVIKSVKLNWEDIQVGVQQILNAARDK